MSRVGQLGMEQKETDFLAMVNKNLPEIDQFDSVSEVLSEHDCTSSGEDGCPTCQMLADWGFLEDGYPDDYPADELTRLAYFGPGKKENL